MPTKPLCKDKNGYQKMLWTYKSRVDEIIKQGKRPSKKLRIKITTLRLALKKYELREQKLNNIRLLIIEFLGIDVKESAGKRVGRYDKMLARNIFFKYCMETGIRGSYASNYLKLSIRRAQSQRLNFTRSFDTNEKNKEYYHRFIKYIESINKNTPQQCTYSTPYCQY